MTPTNSTLTFTIDPAWPWSIVGVGRELFVIVACILVALTVWTYRDVRGANRQRRGAEDVAQDDARA